MVRGLNLAIVFVVALKAFSFAAQPIEVKSEELAVNFSLSDLENKEISLADFQNKPVILFFWTTWCPFCRTELKTLKNLYEKITKDKIGLLTINVGEPLFKVDNFTKRYDLPFKVLLDKDLRVTYLYDVLGVPHYVFINKQGHIVASGRYFNQEIYKELISE